MSLQQNPAEPSQEQIDGMKEQRRLILANIEATKKAIAAELLPSEALDDQNELLRRIDKYLEVYAPEG